MYYKTIKSAVSFLVIVLIIFLSFPISVSALDVSAECAALIVAETGEVLFERAADKKHSMASTTKIMSSLLALESGKQNMEIVATDEMVRVEGTSMGLKAGDKVSVKELTVGMLIQSGNDAANAVALTVGGSLEKFAELMNARAKEIGMLNTSFVTPSGLDDKNHFSTAYDMALLGAEAIKNPEFLAISSKKKITVSFGDPPENRTLYNHNRMLSSYEGAIGIKTGFTKKSGRCLVSAAKRNGVTLVAVTLNAPNDWKDHKTMLDYGFTKVGNVKLDGNLSDIKLPVVGGVKKQVEIKCALIPSLSLKNGEYSFDRVIYLKKFEYAPLKKDKIVGTVFYYKDGKLVAEAPIVTADSVEYKAAPDISKSEKEKTGIMKKIKDRIYDIFNIK